MPDGSEAESGTEKRPPELFTGVGLGLYSVDRMPLIQYESAYLDNERAL